MHKLQGDKQSQYKFGGEIVWVVKLLVLVLALVQVTAVD